MNNEQYQDVAVTEEELRELMGQVSGDDKTLPLIELNVDNIANAKLDQKAFYRGINKVSEVCGMIVGLTQTGISPIDALQYVINTETIQHNYTLAKINNKADIEKIKEQNFVVEKNQL